MSTLTKEQLRGRARQKVKSLELAVTQSAFADSRAELEEELELARIALASLEAEAVCVIDQSNLDYLKSGSDADVWPASRAEMGDVLLYLSATPAPVSVPVEVSWEDVPDEITEDDMEVALAWAHGFNQCRAAMLQSFGNSEQLNSPVIPDGWVACSEQMPEENAEQEVLACFKGGDISTLYYFEGRWDDAYGIVPIRQDVTHWMPLPAAPQQEVKS